MFPLNNSCCGSHAQHLSLCAQKNLRHSLSSHEKNNRRSQLGGKEAKIRGDCHCLCGFLSPQLRVKLMNQTPLTKDPNSQHPYGVVGPV